MPCSTKNLFHPVENSMVWEIVERIKRVRTLPLWILATGLRTIVFDCIQFIRYRFIKWNVWHQHRSRALTILSTPIDSTDFEQKTRDREKHSNKIEHLAEPEVLFILKMVSANLFKQRGCIGIEDLQERMKKSLTIVQTKQTRSKTRRERKKERAANSNRTLFESRNILRNTT